MVESNIYIQLKLELKAPAELHDLVRSFTAIANQFNEFIKAEHPSFDDKETKVFVREIRKGSIIVDLIPFIPPLIENIDRVIIVEEFISKYGEILTRYMNGGKEKNAKKSDVKDFGNQVAAIANDPNGSVTISSARLKQTRSDTDVSFKFKTKDAKKIIISTDKHIKQIDAKAYEFQSRFLMVFWQSNQKIVKTGKRIGEKAIIEQVSITPLAVVYDSKKAKKRIKEETKNGNLYKFGFYVTCSVERLKNKPVAYRISEVHEIIELPDNI